MMRRAFTLMELLVVITIVVILVAILLPVFTRVRENARRTQCISNLRQIYSAVLLYKDDFDGFYPLASNTYSAYKDGRRSLRDTVNRYVSDGTVWECPSDRGEIFPADLYGWRGYTKPLFTFESSSYEYLGFYGRTPWLSGHKDSWVRRPTLAPLVWETRPWHSVCKADDRVLTSAGLANVMYCDGHAVAETLATTYIQHLPHYRDP